MRTRSIVVSAALALAALGTASAEEPGSGLKDVRTIETAARAAVDPKDSAAAAIARRLARPSGTLCLAVVPIEFSDQPRDARFCPADFERLLFSRGTYTWTPSGEPAFGSVADFYAENSCGKLSLEGRAFEWVRAPLPKKVYDRLPIFASPLFLFRAALGRLEAREGRGALDRFDAINFVIAGERGKAKNLLWPHASAVLWRGRLIRYYLTSETEGGKFCAIGVHCHEMGHVLGILDKYGAGPHQGLGVWCTMAVGHRGDRENRDRRPLHLCAFCKERLGWLAPAAIDPRAPQTIRLRPIEGRAGEALKILVAPGGEEYFLLENRQRAGFDRGMPRPGLLIWHVGEVGSSLRNGVGAYRIDLEEAHGRDVGGPHKDLERVPWPLEGQTAFTPFSWPDSNTWRWDAYEVWIRDIRVDGEDILVTIGKPGASPAAQVPRRRAPGAF